MVGVSDLGISVTAQPGVVYVGQDVTYTVTVSNQGPDDEPDAIMTLPVSSESIVFGKYAAALGIYSISLAVSLTHALVLAWLGHPDIGLLGANYFGFWIMGAALIPVAMLASMLAANCSTRSLFRTVRAFSGECTS